MNEVLTVDKLIAALERVREMGHGNAEIEFPYPQQSVVFYPISNGPQYVRARSIRLIETSTDLLDAEKPVNRVVRIHG